ncbi:metal ABC transporter solute-binding protein, Zn/Mn family [Paeniglutamicibacter sp. MACA_103]|uniref:metal ABC transporter solute-binding protein, Zn/Mn family n=1 Tax=Paeniglutamicibacter sp. MACA_103 TaxID=3377337 RepID=UPI003893C29F
MNTPLRTLAVAASILLLSACAGTAPASQGAPAGADPEVLEVLASTSVYADVARAVGGSAVRVSAIVEQTSQDPHSYEATARDKLAVSKADVVIANGGGYDPFMDALAEGPEQPGSPMLHAVDFLSDGGAEGAHASGDPTAPAGHDHAEGNEHVWYDVHTVGALARALADEYSALRPARAEEFTSAAAAFEARIDTLAASLQALRPKGAGKEFAMTEPLAYYLLTEAGMEDGTPAGVSAAMEAGEDLPPLLLKELGDGLAAHRYALLAVNVQTSGPQTDRVASLAGASGVPVLELTETLPAGQDYISWMESNVQQLEVALGR